MFCLADISPCDPQFDGPDRSSAHPKVRAKSAIAQSAGDTDLDSRCDLWRQFLRVTKSLRMFTRRVPVATRRVASSTRIHIAHVVGLVADIQVVRSNTSWVVAMVQHVMAIRNRASSENKRHAVSKNWMVSRQTKPTVSTGVFISSPDPAVVCFVDLFPKSFTDRFWNWCHNASVSHQRVYTS